MNGYKGTIEVSMDQHPIYQNYTKEDFVLHFLESYGQIDGDHHKAWVLDQIARILKGTPLKLTMSEWIVEDIPISEFYITTGEPSQEYLDWVESMKGEWDPENEEFEYWYEEGCAP